MKQFIRFQLSAMMFLQFFIWGLWFVTMGTYIVTKINALGTQVGMAYGTQSLGAIIAPFFVGLIADRYFSAQKILGVLHILGGSLLFMIVAQHTFSEFYPFLLLYMILYMPTLALVNSVALNQMSDSEKQFASIRVWGTIGWIASGLVVAYLSLEQKGMLENTFLMASATSFIFGIFCFTLPNTPPTPTQQKVTWRDIVGVDALQLLKDKNYLVFFVISVLICIPLAFYYQETNIFLNEIGVPKAAGKMSMGQMSETLLLFLMPFFFKYFDVKKMLLMGMIAWALRYFLFAHGDADGGLWMLYLGLILHGICYDFFFVTGQIYTDQKASPAIRSSAQGMITLATYGLGMWVGFSVAGALTDYYKTDAGHDWQHIWHFPAFFAIAIIILFVLFFKEKNKKIKS